MSEELSMNTDDIIKRWDERADRYDDSYKDFRGVVEQYVDLELLKKHLPEDRETKILDAACGTGRMSLPLAKMGYSLTICDISTGMLDVARQKLRKEGVLEKVRILESDVCNMPMPDESFDFVICWGGGIRALKEVKRVTKTGGIISMRLANRTGVAIGKFNKDPDLAISMLHEQVVHENHEYGKCLVVNLAEARKLIQAEGIGILNIFGPSLWKSLSFPEDILVSQNWEKKLFDQTAEVVLRLARDPSVTGLSKYLLVYGEKI
jgi:ubiquinone/menaquinone biosynthesis C-methylase UbiE